MSCPNPPSLAGSHAINPFVFIVGCPRSGTTLLERMVNAHPEIAIVHETHWITRFFEKGTGIRRDGTVTPKLIRRLCEHRRFAHLRMSREDIAALVLEESPPSYADFVSAIFDLYGRREGKRLVGDKTTGNYIRKLRLLHELWPNARIVHLIRDGRDVCLSMLEWPKAHRAAGGMPGWAESPTATTALWWRWHVELGVRGGRSIGEDRYYEMRYESLVSRPQETCAALCDYLEVPFDDAMLRFNEGRIRSDPGLSANQAWLSPTPEVRDWRAQMPRGDVELFEALAGDLLADLGYERAVDATSPEIAAMAGGFQPWW